MTQSRKNAFFTLPATVALAATLSTLSATAETKQDLLSLLSTYGQSWAAHDVDAIVALHSEDTEFRMVVAGVEPAQGKDELRQLLEAIFAANPDYKSTRKNLRLGENYAVFEYEIHISPLVSPQIGDRIFAASDKAYTIPALDVIVFEDGLVKEKITYMDIETIRAMGKGE